MMKYLLILLIFFSTVAKAQDTTNVTMQVGAGAKFAGITVLNQKTGNNVVATITNVEIENNNPELASIVPNPGQPTVIKATGLLAGKGTAVVSCRVSYVDAGDGLAKNEDKKIVISYTVIAAAHGVRLSLTFN